MAEQVDIILYDVPARGRPRSFSPNVWKARAALNFKKCPYRTDWLPYVDLVSTAQNTWKVPRNTPEESAFPYSYPAIQLPDGTYLMESLRIARKLEEIQPEPSLRLDTDHHQRAIQIATQLQIALVPGKVYLLGDILHPDDAALMFRERTKMMGKHPLELAKDPELTGEVVWEKARGAIEALRELIGENTQGPYVMGQEVGFADFAIVGTLMMFKEMDVGGDLYGRLVKEVGERLALLEEACQEWFQRDD